MNSAQRDTKPARADSRIDAEAGPIAGEAKGRFRVHVAAVCNRPVTEMQVTDLDLSNPPDQDRYDRFFAKCPEAFVQQSSWWADCIARLGPDSPTFLVASDDSGDAAGLPLYLFKAETGPILTSVPQPGPLGGIFTRPGLSEAQREQAYAALLRRATEIGRMHDCLTVTLITNPFVDDLALYEQFLSPDYVFENFTQYIPLCEPENWSHGHRNNLNRANRAGFRVEFAQSESELREWYAIHKARHCEIGAQPLDYRLFENMFKYLVASNRAQLILVKKDREIASGGFYIRNQNVVDVFMLSVSRYHMTDSPAFLNTANSLEWARSTGATIYNWQSSPARKSGVYEFKRQWGSIERPYYFVTKRLCPESRLRAVTADRIRRTYPWHYVVPFGLFVSPSGTRRFEKT